MFTLTSAQEKTIKSLHSKKGRKNTGLCLVEGKKNVEAAGDAVDFTFSTSETKLFKSLVTTDTPQDIAAVAKIPTYKLDDIEKSNLIIVLDTVQDPGNVGAILRLCLAFDASLLLVESADPTSPKVIRSSAGALFSVPFMEISKESAIATIQRLNRPVYKLEKASDGVTAISDATAIVVAGSEGNGITLPVKGTSISISHSKKLESLNVGHALAILLSNYYSS